MLRLAARQSSHATDACRPSPPYGRATSSSGCFADLAPTLALETPAATFAHRRFGKASGPPLLLCSRSRGTMDDWDPAFLDLLAARREVLPFDNVGVNATTGRAKSPTWSSSPRG
jgi:hypothetical protein